MFLDPLQCRWKSPQVLGNIRKDTIKTILITPPTTLYISTWQAKNGYIKRVYDEDIKSMVLEIMGTNVSTIYITSPPDPRQKLGIKLPFLILLIKNLHKYFTFEVKVSGEIKAKKWIDSYFLLLLNVIHSKCVACWWSEFHTSFPYRKFSKFNFREAILHGDANGNVSRMESDPL